MAIRGAKNKEDKPLYLSVAWWFKFPEGMLAVIMERMVPQLAKLWNLALAEYLALDEKIIQHLEQEVHPQIKAAMGDDEQAGHRDLWQSKNKKVSKEQWLDQGKPKDRVLRFFKLKGLISKVYTQEVFKYFGYDTLEAEARARAIQSGHGALWEEENAKKKKEDLIAMDFPEDLVEEFARYRALRYDKELMLKHQINSLTALRAQNESYAAIRRTCEEEVLKTLFGGMSSWMMLRAAGDKDAKKPGSREETGFFHAIPNRTSFSVDLEKGFLKVVLGNFCVPLLIPIPCWNEKVKPEEMPSYWSSLTKACKFRQVTLSRRGKESGKQEADLSKPGRFKVSLTFDVPKPVPVPKTEKNTVYMVIGGSAIAVKSALGEEVIHLNVPAKHYRGLDERGKPKGIDLLDMVTDRCTKNSRKYRQRMAKRAKKFGKMSRQLANSLHETVGRERSRKTRRDKRKIRLGRVLDHTLLRHGLHFLVSKIVIRSKEGALADSSKPDRGGVLGANQRAMGDGMAKLMNMLKQKVSTIGGSVDDKSQGAPVLSEQEQEVTRIKHLGLPKTERKRRLDLRKIFLVRRLAEQHQEKNLAKV